MVTTTSQTITAFLTEYAVRLRENGWLVSAAAGNIDKLGEIDCVFAAVHDLPLERSLRSPLRLVTSVRILRRLMKTEQYDVVHVHTPIAAMLVRMAKPLMNAPKVVYTAHGFHWNEGERSFYSAVFRVAERLAGFRTDVLVVINREDEREARRLRLVRPSRLVYMPGIGVSVDTYARAERKPEAGLRQRLGLPADCKVVMSVAELSDRKRPFDVLKAWQIADLPSSILVFVGTGPLLGELSERIRALSLEDQVFLLGQRADVPELLGQSDVFVLASVREGLPRCLLEAMAAEVPIIATDIRGNADLLEPDAGTLVSVRQPDEIAKAMERLFDDPQRTRRLVLNARRRVETYSFANVWSIHDALYSRQLRPSQKRD